MSFDPGSPLSLSVLDFCNVAQPDVGRLCTTLELAMAADRLGFSRYWLAEHFAPHEAHCDAVMLAFAVASVTHHIRVGPAGVLMPYGAPFRVASSVQTLIGFFDDRIDVGLCAGSATPDIHAVLSAQGIVGDPYQRIPETVAYLRGRGATPTVPPRGEHAPPVWLLGSGTRMARLAAEQGTKLCVSLAHSKQPPSPDVLRGYEDAFRPQPDAEAPQVAILVAGACAETADEARRLAFQYESSFVHPTVVGSPDTCRSELLALRERYRIDEICFLDVCPTYEARVRSLELLAAACGLPAPKAPEAPADADAR